MPIYFDNSATTPIDPRVVDAMLPYLSQHFGNPSSMHMWGREARAAVDKARRQVADFVGATANEIIFTASGTEADNMALSGVLGHGDRAVVSAFEHPAVMETCKQLVRLGVDVSYLPVGKDGIVDPDDLKPLLDEHTKLVSVMTANNVVGTIQPIQELSRMAHDYGSLFHTDAVQAAGKISLAPISVCCDLLSLSGHKIYGPKGIGALFIKNGIPLAPVIYGGGQERHLRSGTESVPLIVGLGMATDLVGQEMQDEVVNLVQLRDRIIDEVGLPLIGDRYRRLPGHVCFSLAGYEGDAIKVLLALDECGIAVSSGSACSASHAAEPSYVLQAMGMDAIRARGSLRITLGKFNTNQEVDEFISVMPEILASLNKTSSFGVKND